MIFLKLFACLFAFASAGWAARSSFSTGNRAGGEQLLLQILAGMGLLSALYFLLAVGGAFHGRYILAASCLLPVAFWCTGGRALPRRKDVASLMVAALCMAMLAFALYRITPPYEAIMGSDDASVYSAAAGQLAKSGGLSYHDSLVQQMTPMEREAFFRNRYREDWTGPEIRFAGGVRLTDASRGTVYFAFYHMAPVWLAFSIKAFGPIHYPVWLSLISALTLLVLFFLGKRIAGPAVGLALAALLFLLYPQQYFSRFPLSEPFAQLFFLAGLLSFARSLDSQESPQPSDLRTTGLLWGVSFLCRVDSIYLIGLFLVICLPAIPLFAKDRKRWLPMLRILMVCALAAALNQLAAGEYISLFTNSENLRHGVLTDLGLDFLTASHRFVTLHPVASGLLFVALAAVILFFPIQPRSAQTGRWPRHITLLLTLVSAAILLLPVTGIPRAGLLFNHVRWFFPYAPPPFWILLAAGVLFLAIRERKRGAVQVCLILLALSCAYLFRPLIMPEQPWGMRRFVPALLPLLFLLGISGWFRALQVLARTRPVARTTAFFAAVALAGLLLYSKTAYLLQEPLYGGVFSACDTLAAKIPRGALVLIPDAMAGLHLELPLRYRSNIDTLLLPLDYKTGRRMNATVRGYLDGSLQSRPVVVLSSRGTDDIYPLWKYYSPRFADSVPFSIQLVPRADRYQYPQQTERMNFQVSVFELSATAPQPAEMSVLSYDDPRLTFLHFYDKEAGFRWSRDNSIVTGFAFPAKGKDVELLIETGPRSPQLTLDRPDLQVLINYEFPAQYVKTEGHTIHYLLKGGMTGEIRAVTLLTNTFREPPGPPPPLRDLGISFVRLTLR